MPKSIAIVGMGLRFPPACDTPDAFWKFLLDGGDAIAPVPADRWDPRRFYDEDAERPGKTYVAKGGFLRQDVRSFDPMVFGISPREASGIDPQQRLLLETAWEAFEDAGLPVGSLEDSPTGVFLGGFCLDHLLQIAQPPNRALAGAHSATSASMTILANRLSYAFNLRGPSFTLDTACSSSLVALHCACRAIAGGECSLALAGGSNVMMRPEYPVMMSKGKFLSWHGNCRAFDESGAGYVRGEGAGIVVLKPLERAMADGDRVYAVVRGTGVNQDGRTSGISLPNSRAQEELMREVCARAGVEPAQVDYVEAHGTGTQAGDPAEARALDAVFREGRRSDDPLRVGSVKTNIGHLEAAAGVAGVIKAALILRNRGIPRNLHFRTPNPGIPFESYKLRVVDANEELPSPREKPVLLAGVNSFGYGGTNAHVILSSAPEVPEAPSAPDSGALRLFPVSARSPEALREAAGRLAFQVRRNKGMNLDDLYHTLTERRSHLGHRLVAVASGAKDLRGKLVAASSGEESPEVRLGGEAVSVPVRPVFVCTGMGPQWWAMGRELFREMEVCREALDEIDEVFGALAGWSIREEMLREEKDSRMSRTEVAQPANFVIQVALARLWRQWGIEPAALVGHSVGEVSAAYLAGVYSLGDAVAVSYHRSRLQQTTAGKGGMLAVGLSEEEAGEYLAGVEGVSVAAVNSFSAVTLSGGHAGLETVAGRLAEKGIFHKPLRVEVAYHSPQMDPLRGELLESLSGLRPRAASLPLYSTVLGGRSGGPEWTAGYWWENVRNPVRFAECAEALLKEGRSVFLEVGPHPVLGNSIREVAAGLGSAVRLFPSLRRKEPETACLRTTLADLFCAGVRPDWKALSASPGRFVDLPRYPWQRRPYWNESDDSRMDRLGLPGPVYQNQRIRTVRPTWEVEINRNFFPFLPDHGVQGQTVFPGMGYVEAALTLARTVHGAGPAVLRDVDFEKFLIVDPARIQNLVSMIDPATGAFEIGSRFPGESGEVERHARGRVTGRPEGGEAPAFDLEAARLKCPKPLSLEALYEKLQRRGLHYGPSFRPIEAISTGRGCFFAELRTGDGDRNAEGHVMHPTLLDACLQPLLYIAKRDRLFVPNGIRRLRFFGASGSRFFAFGTLLKQTPTALEGEVWLADESGRAVAVVENMTCQAIDSEGIFEEKPLSYLPQWREERLDGPEPASPPAPDLVLGFEGLSDPGIHGSFEEAGAVSRLIDSGTGDPEVIRRTLAESLPRGGAVLSTIGTVLSDDPGYEEILAAHQAFLTLIRALQTLPGPWDLTVLTRRAQPSARRGRSNLAAAALPALGTLAANECRSLRFRAIDLDGGDGPAAVRLVGAEMAAGTLGEIAIEAGARFSRRLRKAFPEPAAVELERAPVDEPVEMVQGTGNRIAGIGFRRCGRAEPGEGRVEIRMEGAALNFKDYLKAVGRLGSLATRGTYFEEVIGMEGVGTVLRTGPGVTEFSAGDRVVGFVPRAFRSHALAEAGLLAKAPPGSGLEAAGITVVYLTAVHALERIAGLRAGERVLIHQAAGGLGLAAIDVARAAGAEIHATAGSPEKRDLLRSMGIGHVYGSRDLMFADAIAENTAGEGVDVVLSALDGPAQHESLALLRSGGRFVEVGKRDILENTGLPLRAFNRNIIFASVDVDRLIRERPSYIRELLAEIVGRMAAGDLRTGSPAVFPAERVREAFEEMGRGRHTGKIVVDFRSGGVDVPASGRLPGRIRADGAYLVTGGTSGFGLETAKWLSREGAGRIVLLSRRGMAAEGLAEVLSVLEDEETDVVVETGDVTDPAALGRVAVRLSGDGFRPAGIVHGAMVLDDAALPEMTPERFEKVMRPKVAGLLAMVDHLPCAELDFLVCYSSVSALIGNRAQANYVAANALLDAMVHDLRLRGVPALSINWGALAETGVVARSGDLGGILESAGVRGLSNREALGFLARALAADIPHAAAFAVDWDRWKESHPALAGDSRFREHVEGSGGGEEDPVLAGLRAELEPLSADERAARVERRLAEGLSTVLKIPGDRIQSDSKLSEMGVDSLLLLELSLELKGRTGVSIPAMEFLKGPSLRDLSALVIARALPGGG
ncbi:MAG: SDR family NAD(P)-dependent oxidoreductase [Puniceicoccaceae bacterium]